MNSYTNDFLVDHGDAIKAYADAKGISIPEAANHKWNRLPQMGRQTYLALWQERKRLLWTLSGGKDEEGSSGGEESNSEDEAPPRRTVVPRVSVAITPQRGVSAPRRTVPAYVTSSCSRHAAVARSPKRVAHKRFVSPCAKTPVAKRHRVPPITALRRDFLYASSKPMCPPNGDVSSFASTDDEYEGCMSDDERKKPAKQGPNRWNNFQGAFSGIPRMKKSAVWKALSEKEKNKYLDKQTPTKLALNLFRSLKETPTAETKEKRTSRWNRFQRKHRGKSQAEMSDLWNELTEAEKKKYDKTAKKRESKVGSAFSVRWDNFGKAHQGMPLKEKAAVWRELSDKEKDQYLEPPFAETHSGVARGRPLKPAATGKKIEIKMAPRHETETKRQSFFDSESDCDQNDRIPYYSMGIAASGKDDGSVKSAASIEGKPIAVPHRGKTDTGSVNGSVCENDIGNVAPTGKDEGSAKIEASHRKATESPIVPSAAIEMDTYSFGGNRSFLEGSLEAHFDPLP